MVFSSHVFIFYFLPIALGLYYACPTRWRSLLLTLLSYVFYGWANPWFVFLMLFSTTVDFAAGQYISGRWMMPWWRGDDPAGPGLPSARQRKVALACSICSNLLLLGSFKYLGFAETNLNYLLHLFGHDGVRVFQVVLPVGISFYTFVALSYAIDLYRGEARPARSFLNFACYVIHQPEPGLPDRVLPPALRSAVGHPDQRAVVAPLSSRQRAPPGPLLRDRSRGAPRSRRPRGVPVLRALLRSCGASCRSSVAGGHSAREQRLRPRCKRRFEATGLRRPSGTRARASSTCRRTGSPPTR